MSRWEDFALPATLMFAVVFAVALRQELSFTPAKEALAAVTLEPDYVMTVTAKRLPAECRNAATRSASCKNQLLAGEQRVHVREGKPRLASGAFPF